MTDENRPEHYVKQPEVLKYLNHVTDKYDLRKDMRFNTQLLGADWDDGRNGWNIELSGGSTVHARYLVTCLGLLSKQNIPDIPGLSDFQGDVRSNRCFHRLVCRLTEFLQVHHTAKWPKDFPLEGKRVGVIGSGSTGVQVITEVRLHSFQIG